MYTVRNFKSKKALKDALLAHKAGSGPAVEVYDNSVFAPGGPLTGVVTLEGPHYPAPHSWYAQGKAIDGVLVSVK